MLPVFLSFLIVASLPLGLHTYLLPFAALGLGLFVLPFGFGNSHAARLVADLKPGSAPGKAWTVQLSLKPRVRSGLRALLEDADDLGWLEIRDSRFEYRGDSLRLSFPLARIESARLLNGGVRGLFIPSTRVRVTLSPGSGPGGNEGNTERLPLRFDIAERSSLLLPRFHRVTGEILRALKRD